MAKNGTQSIPPGFIRLCCFVTEHNMEKLRRATTVIHHRRGSHATLGEIVNALIDEHMPDEQPATIKPVRPARKRLAGAA